MDLLLYYGFIFVGYGYLGWGLENLFSYYVHGHRQEEGFLNSYFKPMYAIAMTILTYINKHNDNLLVLLICSFFIPTIVEFITGIIMRYYFNKDYWDYSKQRVNYKGIICLKFSFYWMILAIFCMKIIEPIILNFIFQAIKPWWIILVPIQIAMIILDFIFTLNEYNFKKGIM